MRSAATHFGDLMAPKLSPRSPTTIENGLTTAGHPDLHNFTPLERILLTANGNLQRIVSSYHAKPVDVRVVYNNETATGIFFRQVTLHLDNAVLPFCRATSKVTVTNPDMLLAIASNQIGIGQLFRHFDTLPVFTLRSVQRGTCENVNAIVESAALPCSNVDNQKEGDPFWRLYQLKAKAGITCMILEQFQGSVLSVNEK